MSSVACRNIFFLITCLNLLQISSFLLFDNFGAFLTLGSSQVFFGLSQNRAVFRTLNNIKDVKHNWKISRQSYCVKSLRIQSFSGRIFPHSDCVGKYGPEKLRIWTLFTQCLSHNFWQFAFFQRKSGSP